VYQVVSHPADELISYEQEKKLGEMIVENSFSENQGYTVVHDPYVDSCIAEIHTRLMRGVGTSVYTYNLRVVNVEDPNAFAVPGGQIFIQSGLIRFCHSPEELASVLAHEMGHVEKRHTINGIVKQMGLSVVLALITDGNSSELENISGQLLSGYFSREDESEADDFALQLLEKAAIRPSNLGEVFSRMKQQHGDMEGALNLLSSHPELEQRAQKSSAYMTAPSFQEEKFSMDWERLQRSVQPVVAN
jgi:predicted Zn-dependent protease